MPLCFRDDVSQFTISTGISMRNKNVWRVSNESLNNADNLFARLPNSKHHLRKSLARRPGVIHACVTDVFVMKFTDAARGFPGFEFISLMSREKLFQCI